MICGLFSSFDPGVFSSSLGLNVKWFLLLISLFFLGWQIFVCPLGQNLFLKSIFLFIQSSCKDLFKNLSKVYLLMTSVFFLIISMNLWGLVPFFFSCSSHMSMNLSVSLVLWLGGILYMMFFYLLNLISHLVPLGSPSFLWPLLVVVESVSLIIRPFTLAIRLFANVVAGHLILILIGEFSSESVTTLPISMVVMSFFLAFEMCISGVQAYVFMSLLSLYWSESEDH